MVKVKFFGTFSELMPQKDEQGFWKTEAAGKTVNEVLALTAIGTQNIKYSIYINNIRKESGYVLEDGDILTVMPLLAGG